MGNKIFDEMLSLVDDLELVPTLTSDTVVAVLEKLCNISIKEDGRVVLETEGGRVFVYYDRLPLITIRTGLNIDERDSVVQSLRRAAYDINRSAEMVKVFLEPEDDTIIFQLDAMHNDASSFRQNILDYVDLLFKVMKATMDRFDQYEQERLLNYCRRQVYVA